MRYQEKVIVKDGKGKVVIKNRCNRNRNADDLCDLGFFDWFASPEWTSWKLFWNHLPAGSALSGKERYVFVGIHRGSFQVWVGAAWCCSLSLFCGCMLGPDQTLRSFRGPFHCGRGGGFVLVGVWVRLCPPEPLQGPSYALCRAVLRRGEKETEKRRWLTVAL